MVFALHCTPMYIGTYRQGYIITRRFALYVLGGLLDSKGYGIALPPGSPYRTPISREILRLQEAGRLHVLKTRWWKKRRGGGACKVLRLNLIFCMILCLYWFDSCQFALILRKTRSNCRALEQSACVTKNVTAGQKNKINIRTYSVRSIQFLHT